MSFTYGTQVFAEGSSGYLSRKHLKRAIKYGSRYAAGPLLVASSAHSPVHQPSYPVEHAPLFASKGGYYSSRSLSHHAVSHEAMRYGSTATTAPMTFYSNPICPFAHRVWLSLLETRTPHEFKHVPLDESGAGREWYTPIYRAALGADLDPDSFGAVPVIRDGGLLMAESAPISRYVFAKSSMRPSAEQDARTSIFMDQVAGNIIGPWFVRVLPLPVAAAPRLLFLRVQVRADPGANRSRTRKSQAKPSRGNQSNILCLRSLYRPLLLRPHAILRRFPLVPLGAPPRRPPSLPRLRCARHARVRRCAPPFPRIFHPPLQFTLSLLLPQPTTAPLPPSALYPALLKAPGPPSSLSKRAPPFCLDCFCFFTEITSVSAS
jgi:hypothetical protein